MSFQKNGGGEKPAVSVYAKSKESGNTVSLISAWPNERGTLNARLGKQVLSITVDMDGQQIVLTPDDFGKDGSLYLNIFDAGRTPTEAPAAKPAQGKRF